MTCGRLEARMGRGEVHTGFWRGRMTERDLAKHLVDGRIILNWMFKT
jgi:hypothetical protein